jgi:hypothetical protein
MFAFGTRLVPFLTVIFRSFVAELHFVSTTSSAVFFHRIKATAIYFLTHNSQNGSHDMVNGGHKVVDQSQPGSSAAELSHERALFLASPPPLDPFVCACRCAADQPFWLRSSLTPNLLLQVGVIEHAHFFESFLNTHYIALHTSWEHPF